VTLKAGMLVREPGPRFALHGTGGSFVKHGMDPQEEALKRGLTPAAPNWGEEPEERWGTLDAQLGGLRVRGRVETVAGGYQSFYQNVADAIEGRAELAVGAEEALATARVIEAAVLSGEQKCSIPFTP
jgi:predicted dehydrogenase